MAFDPIEIQRNLQRIEQAAGYDTVVGKAVRSFEENLVSKTSKLGTKLNQIVGGFQALTQEADDVVEILQGSRPEQLIAAFAVSQLTDKVPGLKNKLRIEVGNNRSDLNALTGSSVGNGFLQVQVTSSEPEAIAYHTRKTTGATTGQLKNVLGEVINLEDKIFESFETSFNQLITPIVGAVTEVLASFNKFRANVFSSVLGFYDKVNQELNKGFGSLVENVSEALTGNGRSIIGSMTLQDGIKINLPESDITFVLDLLNSKEKKKLNDAVDFISKYSSYDRATIQNNLSSINNQLSNNVGFDTGNLPVTAREIVTGINTWDGSNTPTSHTFYYVSSVEELEVELKSIRREVTEVVVHWTETFNNQNLDAGQFQANLAKQGSSIPYHYLIRRDGSLQRGRPNQLQGGALANGHEQYSIQIAFVGGINAPTGTINPKRFLSASSLTNKQLTSFQQFCAACYATWPGVQILGHNDIDITQRDPGFDVTAEMESLFGKRTVFEEPLVQGPFSRTELIKKKVI